jgi:hypothetical protein
MELVLRRVWYQNLVVAVELCVALSHGTTIFLLLVLTTTSNCPFCPARTSSTLPTFWSSLLYIPVPISLLTRTSPLSANSGLRCDGGIPVGLMVAVPISALLPDRGSTCVCDAEGLLVVGFVFCCAGAGPLAGGVCAASC